MVHNCATLPTLPVWWHRTWHFEKLASPSLLQCQPTKNVQLKVSSSHSESPRGDVTTRRQSLRRRTRENRDAFGAQVASCAKLRKAGSREVLDGALFCTDPFTSIYYIRMRHACVIRLSSGRLHRGGTTLDR